MTPKYSYDEVVAAVRKALSAFVDSGFSDDDDFIDDLHLASDELSFMTLDLERELDVKLPRRAYRSIGSVRELAQALHRKMSDPAEPG